MCVMAAEGPFCYLKSKAQGYQVIVGSYIKTPILKLLKLKCVFLFVLKCVCDVTLYLWGHTFTVTAYRSRLLFSVTLERLSPLTFTL